MSNKGLTSLGAGLAGAASLTLLHETIRRVNPDAPRMDLLGMSALARILKNADIKPPQKDNLYRWTMAGDLVSNSLYYSLAGIGNPGNVWLRGAALGLAAGVGAVLLPKPLGLNPSYSNRTLQTQLITTSLYLIGGLVTSAAIRWLATRNKS